MTPPSDSLLAARKYGSIVAADTASAIVFHTGRDCHVQDLAGNSYLDFIGGYGVINTGWQRPQVLDAMADQIKRACFAPPWLPTLQALDLAEQILALAPRSLSVCARATGGAEANEIAVKANFAMRGGQILVVGRAYHGGTSRTLSMSDSQAFGLPPTPIAPSPRVDPAYCFRCPFGKTYPNCSLECAQAIDEAMQKDPSITALLLEPVIGSGGAIVPPPAYFDAVQEICRRRKVTLILDEVITGCGRLGSFLAADAFGLQPAAITLAKGLSGGYAPIGAAVLSLDLADSLRKFEDVSATLAWTPLACSAALANIQLVLSENLAAKASRTGPMLQARLREVFERMLPAHLGEVRGKGLLIGIELVTDQVTKNPNPQLARRIALRCLRSGLMLGASWDWHTLILTPPLIVDEAEIDEAVDILERVLKRLA